MAAGAIFYASTDTRIVGGKERSGEAGRDFRCDDDSETCLLTRFVTCISGQCASDR